VLQGKGFRVALVTDGRMSGASGKVPAAIHASPEALAALVAQLAPRDAIGIDTEFLRERTYRADLCLLQLTTPGGPVCVDPIALPDLGSLAATLAVMVAVLASCTPAAPAAHPDSSAPAQQAAGAQRIDPAPPAADTAAVITWFQRRVSAIRRDTMHMERVEQPISLGAGSAGLLTAWRAGPVWRRVRVEGEGTGFRSVDDYWLSDGVLLGARLEVTRPGRKPEVDEVWFRDRQFYRWTDADGRHLGAEARSTQFQVRMMRARFDSLLARLSALDAVRTGTR
jgi:hypothetical protein